MNGLFFFHIIWVVIYPMINGLTNSTAWNIAWFVKRICFLSPKITIFSSILFGRIIVSSTRRKFTVSVIVFWVLICLILVIFLIISFFLYTVFLTHIGIWQMPTLSPKWKAKSLYHVSTFLLTRFFLPFQKLKTIKIKLEKNPYTKANMCLLHISRNFKDIFKYMCFIFIFRKL